MDHLIETWHINNRINGYMLEGVAPEALSAGKTWKLRSVAEQFAHIHNVRLMWLKEGAPDLLEALETGGFGKIDKSEPGSVAHLRQSLTQSGEAIATLLQRGIETGRIKGFKPHPTAFMAYLIAHDSYHRAEAAIILTQAGYALDKKIAFGLWEWGVR